ncbi:MAG TPA: carbohydrate ABC transporter permease [Ruminiclostridium sp.]
MKKLLIGFIAIVTVLSILPFYLVFMMSTYYSNDLFKGLPFLPSDFLLKNFETIFKTNFIQVYGNSIIVSVSAVVLCTLVSSLVGFAIAKYKFKFKKVINNFIIITMMVPMQISIIGYLLEMKTLHLNNTLLPIILVWVSYPFGAFFMTQFIKDSIADEMIESARIDGCSEPRIFATIVVPLIKPGIATLATLVFLWSWNNYLLPLIIINKQQFYTIPILVSTLGTAHRNDLAARMCALALSIFPVIVVFLLGSKTFIKGISAGAVKG